MKIPLVEIVILNCNSGRALQKCIESVDELRYQNKRVIVVDNASYDGSTNFLKNRLDITLIENEKNLGCPAGLNRALPYLKGKYALFLNEDIILDPYCVNKLVDTMESDEKIGIAGMKLYKPREKTPEFEATYLSKHTAYAGLIPQISRVRNKPFEAPYLGLGSILVRNDLFKRIKKFEEIYFIYYEDVNFCLKAWMTDWKVVLVPEAIGYHEHQVSVKRNLSLFKTRYFSFRNSLLTFLVFANPHEILEYTFTIILFRLSELASLLMKRKFTDFSSLTAAIFSSFIHIPWILRKKSELKQLKSNNTTYSDICDLSLPDYIKTRKLFRWMQAHRKI